MTVFQTAVLRIVQSIPTGRVMSYGQVAAALGAPRAARQVGWAMRAIGDQPNFPWWRVVNNQGRITIKNGMLQAAELQKELLQSEGVVVTDTYQLDMAAYRYRLPATDYQSQSLPEITAEKFDA